MSLFPAYGLDVPASEAVEQAVEVPMRWEVAPESELLASSDSDSVECSQVKDNNTPVKVLQQPVGDTSDTPDYYEDRRFDGGNLRVSTIYYPGCPHYKTDHSQSIGLHRLPLAVGKRPRRYWERAGVPDAGGEEGERAKALRRALAEQPKDEMLWMQYIDHQEWLGGVTAALSASEEAAARLPRARGLRARRLAALARALSPHDYLTKLRDELAQEKEQSVRAELWALLVLGVARAGGAAVDVAAAAAADLRRLPRAYPHLLHAYGLVLRAAGLWETLVLFLELLICMNCAPASFPRDERSEELAEERLLDYEDKVISSGLPSGAVWARVERARGAAHWRAARDVTGGDPARAPAPAHVAPLLLPLADPDALLLLAFNALRLAKVPLLPGAQYLHSAVGSTGEWDCGEGLLTLVRAARRLPPAHPARAPPKLARALVRMFVDPPHYFSDDYGYRSWVDSLWEACAGCAGAAGVALLCWRLRWLHAQLLLVANEPECAGEARRIRDAAQTALRRAGGAHPLPFALFARVAHAAGAGAGLRAALVALRAALHDAALPHHYILYIARIVCEVAPGAAGSWALVSAVLRRAPPQELGAAPPGDLVQEALQLCEQRCAELEAEMASEPSDGAEEGDIGCGAALRDALLPSEAEWGAARAALAGPRRRRQLLDQLMSPGLGRGRAARWREQQAAALVGAASGAARALAPLFPNNALLALMAGGAPLWAGGAEARAVAGATGGLLQLCAAWPALLRAAAKDWAPEESGVVARCLRRLDARGAGGALLWAARLEAEARAPRPRLERVAYAALDVLPHHKWLAVRCGALGAGGAELPDLLLDRGLRLHALPDELRPLDLPAGPGQGPGQGPDQGPDPGPDQGPDQPMAEESNKARRLSVVRRTFAVRPPCGSGACAVRDRSDILAPPALPVGLLLAFLLAAAATEVHGNASSERAVAGSGAGELDNELEDEVDDAPFAIVVEHLDGWRCGGALVSMRTALTSAACARGRGGRPSAELLARAASAHAPTPAGTRRVSRVAYASDGTEPEGQWHEVGAWLGAALDLALLELESPFESSARARPILMAATVEECTKTPPCHVVRTPTKPGALRVGLLTPAPSATCAAAAHHWASVSEKLMCLTGPELCPSDWGSGVVCAGKLCGVLSRSARAVSAMPARGKKSAQEATDGPVCGNIHAAQSTAGWRNFLHCAHTLRACGRDNCATQCSERQLVEPVNIAGKLPNDDGEPEATTSTTSTTESGPREAATPESSENFQNDVVINRSEETTSTTTTQEYQTTVKRSIMPPPVGQPRRQLVPLRIEYNPGPPPIASEGTVRRMPFEFEPGRPDFKAGEYGDNAADYGDGVEGPTRTPSQTPPARTAAPLPAPRIMASSSLIPHDPENFTYLDQTEDALEAKNRAAYISKPFLTFLMVILYM